jgi:hypothetical protein
MSSPPFNTLYLAEPSEADYLVQRAFEILISMPTLMEQADTLDVSEYTTEEAAVQGRKSAEHLLRLVWKLNNSFQDWHTEMSQVIAAPIRVYVPGSPPAEACRPQVDGLQYARKGDSYIWILYWKLSLYLNQLIKKLQTHHTKALQMLAKPLPLPLELAQLGKEYSLLDQYAENIRDSLIPNLGASAFYAQESIISVFALHLYWEQRGEADKIGWCLEALRTMGMQGLSLDLNIHERPSLCTCVRLRLPEEP